MKACLVFRAAVFAVTASLSGGCLAADGADPSPLDSHVAIYAMKLNHAKSGGGIAGASGDLYYKFSDVCDGWAVESRFLLNVALHNGGQTSSNTEFLSWESKDGHTYRFRMRTTQDGVLKEEVRGQARTNDEDEGTAVINAMGETEVRLAKGTLFPTRHTEQLLKAAAEGEQFQERLVFDGAAALSSYVIDIIIGQASAEVRAAPGIDQTLLTPPSWPVQAAFFTDDDNNQTPDFEMMSRYYSNGVVDDIVQIFETFSLKGTMLKLELAPKPDC